MCKGVDYTVFGGQIVVAVPLKILVDVLDNYYSNIIILYTQTFWQRKS